MTTAGPGGARPGPPPGGPPAAAGPDPAGPSLAGLTVLVPRARDQAGGFSVLLAARGAEALEVPTIEIRQVASTTELDRAVGELFAGRFDWVVLTSVNGVAALRSRVEALGQDLAAVEAPAGGRVELLERDGVVGHHLRGPPALVAQEHPQHGVGQVGPGQQDRAGPLREGVAEGRGGGHLGNQPRRDTPVPQGRLGGRPDGGHLHRW